MNFNNLSRLSALLPLLVLCSADGRPARVQDAGVVHLPITVLLQPIGDMGDNQELFLITTLPQYKQLFGENATGVDFRRDWAFLYSAGLEPTGGYEATVADVSYTADVKSLVITTSLVSPGVNCGVPQIVTHPYVLVKFPKPPASVGIVRLQKDDLVLDCSSSFGGGTHWRANRPTKR